MSESSRLSSPLAEPLRSAAPRCLVMVATYNELENLPHLVEGIEQSLPTADILVVDDNSPDGTGRWCDERSRHDARLQCLHRTGKQGLGAAVLAGLEYAVEHDYDVVINMDADLSHPPAVLPQLVAQLFPAPDAMSSETNAKPADLAIGSRYVRGGGVENWPWQRRCLSWMVNFYSRHVLRIPARDCSGGYRAYRVSLLRSFNAASMESRGYAFFEEQLWRLHRAGARIVETPITFVDRRAGESKVNLGEMRRSAFFLLRLGVRTWL